MHTKEEQIRKLESEIQNLSQRIRHRRQAAWEANKLALAVGDVGETTMMYAIEGSLQPDEEAVRKLKRKLEALEAQGTRRGGRVS